jgi:hypothetical protein
MYLINPERKQDRYFNGFFASTRKILEKYYLCKNDKEINHYFDLLLRKKQDPLKQERIRIKDEIFINIGSSGHKIVEYLEKILNN